MKTTKTANKKAIKALLALRASLLWYKRDTLRAMARRLDDAQSPATRNFLASKIAKVRATDLADLRASYQAQRIGEIRTAGRFELSRVIPGIVWL